MLASSGNPFSSGTEVLYLTYFWKFLVLLVFLVVLHGSFCLNTVTLVRYISFT